MNRTLVTPAVALTFASAHAGPTGEAYTFAWIVERFFAWMQWRRRLLVRWKYYPINFLGFVQLAAICIVLGQI